MSEQTNFEQIERYLLGQMDQAEREAFEQRLNADAALRQEVALQQKITQHVRQVGREDMRRRLQAIHRTMEQEESNTTAAATGATDKRPEPQRPWYSVYRYTAAASVVMLVGLAVYWYVNNRAEGEKPQLAYIRYSPTGADPSFGIANPDADQTAPVLIYPASTAERNTYRFDDTLRLYGSFDPTQLRLVYRPASKTYELQMQDSVYVLQRNGPRQPLRATPR